MNIKQRKIQIEPKTKLNYNIYIHVHDFSAFVYHQGSYDFVCWISLSLVRVMFFHCCVKN